MSARQSSAVEQALALIGKPRPDGAAHTPYSAAKAAGIALSTIYRAIARGVKPEAKDARQETAKQLPASAPASATDCTLCNGTGFGSGEFPVGGCKACGGTGKGQNSK